MSYHSLQLVNYGGEPHVAFVCTAPDDAPCRRRPEDETFEELENGWTLEQATETGHQCWAVEWVAHVGISDAIAIRSDTKVLAEVPVDVHYDEGVILTLQSEDHKE